MRVAVFYIAAVLVLSLSNCREVQPYQPPPSDIQGFQLNGRVTTANGRAVDSALIVLDYDLNLIGTTPMDTIPVVEPDPPKLLNVEVFDAQGLGVRELFTGVKPAGPVSRFGWNGLDDNGHPVPSGKYRIRYMLDTAVIKIVPYLVRDHVTAQTDAQGNFTIWNDNLPIGEQFDYYRQADNSFQGVVQVSPNVYLFIQRGSLTGTAAVTLQRNTLYHGAFTIE